MRVKGMGGERERNKRVHTREREKESERERNQESERERERKRERGEERQEKSITGSESQSDTLCLSKTHPEISTWEILKQRPPLERALDQETALDDPKCFLCCLETPRHEGFIC